MHILFLTDNFPPEVNAPASRTFEHAREWVKQGHQVTVITCTPNFPDGKVFEGYRNKLWQSEVVAGIRVIRVWSFISRNQGFVRRILDYQSYMISSFFASLFVRHVDVVVGTSPQFFTVCAAWASAAVKRRPFVFELRDIWPESIRAVGAMKASKVLDVFERMEMFLYRRAKAIVSVTHSFKDTLVQRGIDGAKIHVVTNGVDTSQFSPRAKDPELLNEHGLTDAFVAGYIGTHGMAHALETLVDAARLLEADPDAGDIKLMMLGNGARRDAIIARAAGLSNITFVETVSKKEVARYWSLLDVAIIHLRRNDLFKTVIPSKMFECMGMGIPIVHGVEGESADIIARHDVGVPVEPENPAALAAALKRLHARPDLRDRFRQNGLNCAQQYERTSLADEMLLVLTDVVG
ncbi:glycosyltransferase family 4 protein [Yoonia sp. GPGPB17]|uniref:glycosyltransferase family 4 protein n=1 Tax=Yoonia sp. GPGPB17 TaxID=3026147 RepID=UPI0030EEE7EC